MNDISEYVRLFHKSVFRLAYSYVKNREDADDICQDAFIRLMDYNGEFPTAEDCKRWLFRVTINLSKNLLGSGRVTRTSELNESLPSSELTSSSSENKELWALVRSIPPKYGAVIHLYYYEGYSVKEIAEIMRISVTAVTSRLSRGRDLLKTLLKEE